MMVRWSGEAHVNVSGMSSKRQIAIWAWHWWTWNLSSSNTNEIISCSDCRTWGQRGYCKTGSYVSYMKKNCKKTCKLCWIYYLNTRVYIFINSVPGVFCVHGRYVLFVFYSWWKTLIGRLHPCLTGAWRENWHVQCIATFCQCGEKFCLHFTLVYNLSHFSHCKMQGTLLRFEKHPSIHNCF